MRGNGMEDMINLVYIDVDEHLVADASYSFISTMHMLRVLLHLDQAKYWLI